MGQAVKHTGPAADVAEIVMARCNGQCERCGASLRGPLGFSRQHRIARGMGGTKGAWVNFPSNIAMLCGSATTGCHGEVERRRMVDHGWWLFRHEDPAAEPITLWDGRRVVLGDDGCYGLLAA